jgi:hypothetical protein
MSKTPHLRVRPMDRPVEGQSRPRFGQLAGRSVFNTRIDYHPNSILLTSSNRASPLFPVRILAPPLVFGRGPAMWAARVLAIVRAWSAWRALQGCKPHRRQRSSSPACPLLRLLSCRARVLGARQPVVQETESAGTDLKDDAYGGLLLMSRPRRRRSQSAHQAHGFGLPRGS